MTHTHLNRCLLTTYKEHLGNFWPRKKSYLNSQNILGHGWRKSFVVYTANVCNVPGSTRSPVFPSVPVTILYKLWHLVESAWFRNGICTKQLQFLVKFLPILTSDRRTGKENNFSFHVGEKWHKPVSQKLCSYGLWDFLHDVASS